MESDTERGVGSFGNDGEELSQMMTITSLNRGMDSIVAKAGTLSTLDNIKGITSFERKFKRAIDTTPFGCSILFFLMRRFCLGNGPPNLHVAAQWSRPSPWSLPFEEVSSGLTVPVLATRAQQAHWRGNGHCK